MGRKKTSENGVNKSAVIREILEQNPKASMKEVTEALNGRGLKASQNLIYFVKAKMGRKRRRQKRQQAVEASQQAGVTNPIQLVREVQGVAAKAGGMRKLKELVDLLAQ